MLLPEGSRLLKVKFIYEKDGNECLFQFDPETVPFLFLIMYPESSKSDMLCGFKNHETIHKMLDAVTIGVIKTCAAHIAEGGT